MPTSPDCPPANPKARADRPPERKMRRGRRRGLCPSRLRRRPRLTWACTQSNVAIPASCRRRRLRRCGVSLGPAPVSGMSSPRRRSCAPYLWSGVGAALATAIDYRISMPRHPDAVRRCDSDCTPVCDPMDRSLFGRPVRNKAGTIRRALPPRCAPARLSDSWAYADRRRCSSGRSTFV